jgi:hypothetical protein
MATQKTQKQPSTRQRPPLPPRRKMPVWLRNPLIGLIIFTVGLIMGILFQFVVCAVALGVAVYQLYYRRGRWLWTWLCFLGVALFVLGVYLAMRIELAWFLYFGAWIFVIVAVVGEGSRVFQGASGASTD